MPYNSKQEDIVILGGQVIDGTGSDPFPADIKVKDGRIVSVGDLPATNRARIIRADGLYVVPGFVDMHTHSERGLYIPELAPSLPYLTQGVTTVVGGADGYGSWPLHESVEDHIGKLERQGIGTNAVLMVGSGQVRRLVMGNEPRWPQSDELASMRRHVREAMEGGAWGLSSGLEYPPGSYGKTEEVVSLASEVAPYGGMYHTHMRSEGDELLDAVSEAITITEQSGAVGVLTHLKALYQRNWGKVGAVLDKIDEARSRGVKVYADQYPFADAEVLLVPQLAWMVPGQTDEARSVKLDEIIRTVPDSELIDLYGEMAALPTLSGERRRFLCSRPELLREMIVGALGKAMPSVGAGLMELASWYGVHRGPGNPEERINFLNRLDHPVEGVRIRRLVMENVAKYGGAGQVTVVLSSRTELQGKTLEEVSRVLEIPVVDAAVRLFLEGSRAMADILSDEDVVRIMSKDYVATGSDGDYPYYGTDIDSMGITQHLRTYATFTTKLRRYAMDRGIVSLTHAIRSCTGLPAEILGWRDRGLIKAGQWADITVLDPHSLEPRSNPHHPHRYSGGVRFVLVNGHVVLTDGQSVGALAGKVLRIQDR